MPPRKLLSQQKGNLTVEQQEIKKMQKKRCHNSPR